MSPTSPKMFRVPRSSVLAPDLMNVFISELARNTEGKPMKVLNDTKVKGSLGTGLQILNDLGRFWGPELVTVSCNLIGVILKPILQNQKQIIGWERLRLISVFYEKRYRDFIALQKGMSPQYDVVVLKKRLGT